MDGIKLKRLESTTLKEMSLWILNKSKDEELKEISITAVKITNDLSFMTIYYTIYTKAKEEHFAKVLEDRKGEIRTYLASKIKARKMPELIFKYDTSLDYGNHIDNLIKNINNENK